MLSVSGKRILLYGVDAPVKGLPVENYYRFHAQKGEKLMFEVLAKRLDSEHLQRKPDA